MSSNFATRQDRYLVAATASQFAVGASIVMIVYVLMDGWLW